MKRNLMRLIRKSKAILNFELVKTKDEICGCFMNFEF